MIWQAIQMGFRKKYEECCECGEIMEAEWESERQHLLEKHPKLWDGTLAFKPVEWP